MICQQLYSILPNRRVYTFISSKVCLLTLIETKRQTSPEINIQGHLFRTLKYVYETKTAADTMIWEVSARKSADIHESSQLIHYYLYFVGKWMWGLRQDQRGAKELKRNTGQWLWCPILIPEAAVEAVGGQYRVCNQKWNYFICIWQACYLKIKLWSILKQLEMTNMNFSHNIWKL